MNRCVAPRIVKFDTSLRCVFRITPRQLYPHGKSPRYSLLGSWVGPRAGQDGVEKRTMFTASGNRTPDSSADQPVSVLTELSRY
jgi:hypothetical protein